MSQVDQIVDLISFGKDSKTLTILNSAKNIKDEHQLTPVNPLPDNTF